MNEKRIDMDKKNIDNLKTELEVEGYEFVFVDGRTYVIAPDGWQMEALGKQGYYTEHLADIVPIAYQHMQECRELEALRVFVLRVRKATSFGFFQYNGKLFTNSGELIEQFNITTEDDSK